MSTDVGIGPEGLPAAPRQRGWFGRNWWWFVPLLVVLLLLVCAVLCAGIIGGVFFGLKSSEPYQMALKKVQQDPQVIAALGEPIQEASWAPSGNVSKQDGGGEARVFFDVEGPKGKARVHAEGRRMAGQWSLHVLFVELPGGRRIQVLRDEGLEEAPPFQPGPPPEPPQPGQPPKTEPPQLEFKPPELPAPEGPR